MAAKTFETARMRTTRVTPRVMTPAQRLKELRSYVDICFAMLEEQTYAEVAENSGLSLGTIYRLQNHDFTLRVQFRTVQALGIAAGLRLEWTKYAAAVKLIA